MARNNILMLSACATFAFGAVAGLTAPTDLLVDLSPDDAGAIHGGGPCFVDGPTTPCPPNNFKYLVTCTGAFCQNGICPLTAHQWGEDAGHVTQWHPDCVGDQLVGKMQCLPVQVWCINMNVCNGCQLDLSGYSVCAPNGRAKAQGHMDHNPGGADCNLVPV